jgi:imidazolonepropionase-like amidohydrolase
MRPWMILSLVMACAISVAQVETEADRKPKVVTGGNVMIKNARILTVTRGTLANGDILVVNGKIAQVGTGLTIPPGTTVIDATGKVVSPGIVDAHIHRGIDATNEGSDSITAECRIGDVLNPNNRNVWAATAGGETSGLALHGSANCIGGESQIVKLKYGRTASDMLFPDAPRVIKFALGENVTRSGSTSPTRFPRTRMGVQQVYRRAFTEARAYIEAWDAFEKGGRQGKAPRRDVRLDTLADILRGKVWVNCHSYRADEMLMMVRLSQEFGFKLATLQHGLEAYKIAPELAKAGIGASIFVDNWSFKVEGYDGIPYNAAISTNAGVNVSINTDGVSGVPSIAIDAAKTMRYGGMSEDQALAMITINPARQLGIDGKVGSIEVGKDADIVVWQGHPLSVYSKTDMTLIDGEVVFQRRDAFGVDKASTLKNELSPNAKRAPIEIPAGKSAYVIKDAMIFPISRAPFTGSIRIEGDMIAAVGQEVSTRGAHVINGRGLQVYPGFVDAGNSMGLSEISPIGQTVDTTELGSIQPDLNAATAIQAQSEHFPVARMGGVLISMTRPSGGVISGQAATIKNGGWNFEDMSLGRDLLVVTFAGGAPPSFDECGCMDMGGGFNPDDSGQMLPRKSHEGHEHEEEMGGGGLTAEAIVQASSELERYFTRALEYDKKRTTDPATPLDVQLEAMRPYVRGERPILIRVRAASAIRAAVEFGKKTNVKIILSGAPDAWKVADLLAKEKVPVLINPAGRSTLSANSPANDFDPYDTTFALPFLLKKAGVKFAFQSEDNSGAFNLPVRVGQSCAYGLTPADALRALTVDAAEILGIEGRYGTLEGGKKATLFISDGDPFELTSNVVGVFMDGTPMPLVSRFTRLRDQWGPRPALK